MALSDLHPYGVIDAHHHIWAPESRGDDIGYGWLRDLGAPKPFGDPTPIQRDYLLPEFLAEAPRPLEASIHVQTDPSLPDPVAETRFVQAQLDQTPNAIGKMVVFADLSAPDLPTQLVRHMDSDDVVGLRQIVARLDHRPDLTFASRDFLSDTKWLTGLVHVAENGLSFDLQMYPEQAEAALRAFDIVPDLQVIIDHALCPYNQSAEGYARWAEAVGAMAGRSNTYIKLSGWGMYDPDWAQKGVGAIQPYIDTILRAFGPDRVMWGSNYPVEKLSTPYDKLLDLNAKSVPANDHLQVFRNTAMQVYLPTALPL
ncbi:amidohydrolase family protein [Gymnodinialimonas sp. 2305UL16-5]|uniref:amidohydrolase family protein n=1 Tax=Gymnodinialimonas mytili TaxID=3126503 RepID=UPI0030A369F0